MNSIVGGSLVPRPFIGLGTRLSGWLHVYMEHVS